MHGDLSDYQLSKPMSNRSKKYRESPKASRLTACRASYSPQGDTSRSDLNLNYSRRPGRHYRVGVPYMSGWGAPFCDMALCWGNSSSRLHLLKNVPPFVLRPSRHNAIKFV